MRKFSSVLAPIARWVMLVALAVGTGPGPLAALPAQAAAPAAPVEQAAAGSTTLRLSVVSARTVTAAEVTPPAGTGPNGRVAINAGAAVSAPYRWIINQDNTGDPFQPRFPDCSPYYESATTPGQPDFSRPNPNYPASCNWPSIRGQQAYAPIVAQGTEAMLNTTAGVAGLPDGRYLISVSADGFKLDGAHFLVRNGLIYPSEATPTALNNAYAVPAPNGLITVAVQPLPLPTSTLRAKLFRDTSIVNGMFDSPAEDGNGLSGWRGHLADVLGEVTTDVFGNPLCTEYYTDVAASDAAGVAAVRAVFPAYVPGGTGRVLFDADGAPAIRTVGGGCFSDANGDLVIPNMGPGRYAYSVTPPADQVGRWIQTSTLEGNHDYDTWVLEGSTGFDTEFVNQAEPFPWTIFGFVERTGQMAQMPGAPASERIPTTGSASFTGEVRGVVAKTQVFVPMTGGLPYLGNLWGGFSGAKVEHPIAGAWVALTDLQAGDQAVYVGQADENGAFRIRGVRDGDYTLTYWDEPQTTLLDLTQVTIINGQVVDAGTLMVAGWFAGFSGHVFLDTNENGRMDPGEAGLDNLVLSVKRRSNSLVDRGAVQVTTTGGGHWFAENTYPFGSWIVIELYSDLYRNTGYTFQAGNQPEETIITPGAVDVSILPIIGQTGRLDIGVAPYKPGENGGIAGSVSYGTTRNELDPRHLAVENWQPGIPGLTVNLWAPVACGTNAGTPCDATRTYELAADGSFARGALLNSAVTEQWTRPTNCVVRDVSGNPTTHQWVLPTDPNAECLEGPLTGIQFGQEQQTLDGNFGFGTMFVPAYGAPGATEETLPAGDYIVEVVIPTTTVTLNTGAGLTQVVQPVYTPTREEDINVFSGSSYVPQQLPPSCVGPLHTVDVAGIAPDGPNAVENPTFVAEGGSPFEGQARPLCTMKLVTVQNQRSVAPLFELFTPVAIPARWFGYIVDDLNVSTDPATLFYGEKAGVKHSPVGLYDFANRLSYTVYSDPNGVYEPLMPSTETINCPSPSGVCTGMYRHVGNDPGQPGRLNPHYDPQFRTISANFELFPGDIIISDLAPTQIGVSIQSPGSQQHAAVQCRVADTTPQIMAVSPRPYVYGTAASGNRDLTIVGQGFGTVQGTGRVTLSTNANAAGSSVTILQWTANRIRIRVPSVTNGAYHLQVQNDLGQVSTNGVTVHVLGTAYQPRVFEVNSPGAPPGYAGAWGGNFGTIQAALNAARAYDTALVVVYPGTPSLFNPTGAWFENVVINSPVKLQGVGPGGTYLDASGVQQTVLGSVINGNGFGGDTPTADAWRTLVAGLQWAGNQQIYEGAVVTVLARQNSFQAGFRVAVDGFIIEGGDQLGFPNNINQIGGGTTGQPAVVEVQGGGIYINGHAHFMQVTNNILRSNGGAYGGAIRVGTPNAVATPAADGRPAWDGFNWNDNILIARNQILANGGTNLAGAIGLFQGSDTYEVAWNHICGNFSAEYGGGISHYGYSPNSSIHNNRIYFNRSMDEGGGIMIAGELPADPNTLTIGAGQVSIYSNIIQSNLSNDDGGGLRFLMAQGTGLPGTAAPIFRVYNNIIVNNISTHEGGGVSLNDAPNVRFYNNTVMKNLTTATALTSNGAPAPAGLSTSRNSTLLQATLARTAPLYSQPLLFNNIFWDNRAGSFDLAGGVSGIGLPNDPNPIYTWDIGAADRGIQLPIWNSFLSAGADTRDYRDAGLPTPTVTVGVNPLVVSTYDTTVEVLPWRGNPRFVGATIVAQDVPPTLMGNYHLQAGSPAVNAGAFTRGGQTVATTDIDGDPRPTNATNPLNPAADVGADEIGPRNNFILVLPDSQVFDTLYLPFVRR